MYNIFKSSDVYPVKKEVIVNLKSGTSFSGVWFDQNEKYMTLKNAICLQDLGQKTEVKADGDIIIFVSDIDFIQVI